MHSIVPALSQTARIAKRRLSSVARANLDLLLCLKGKAAPAESKSLTPKGDRIDMFISEDAPSSGVSEQLSGVARVGR